MGKVKLSIHTLLLPYNLIYSSHAIYSMIFVDDSYDLMDLASLLAVIQYGEISASSGRYVWVSLLNAW